MYDRIIKLIGEDALNTIKSKHVLIVGIGGVGETAAETLVRSGIGKITVIDGDVFNESNLNRQILATTNEIGLSKVDVCKKRLLAINPDLDVNIYNAFLNTENSSILTKYDYIIDACDDINAKILLIKYAQNNNIKIISSMGTGKRLDPSKVKISTLNKTYNDPLAKVMRKRVKDEGLKLNVPVVFSEELPLNNDEVIGSMMFVPSSAGLMLAYYVINDIINKKE